MRPTCPVCGSLDGELGTQFAYFYCRHCARIQYWTAHHDHPADHGETWESAIEASPWGRARRRLEARGISGVTPEQASKEVDREHDSR